MGKYYYGWGNNWVSLISKQEKIKNTFTTTWETPAEGVDAIQRQEKVVLWYITEVVAFLNNLQTSSSSQRLHLQGSQSWAV